MAMNKCCIDCASQTKGVERISDGVYAFPTLRQSRCETCQTDARGFRYCLACATEREICQGCGQSEPEPDQEVALAIAGHRQALEAAQAAAAALYAQTIEPFKEDVVRFEATVRLSKEQMSAEFAVLTAAKEAAFQRWNSSKTTAEHDMAWTEYLDAEKSLKTNEWYKRHRERVRKLASGFSNHEIYTRAVEVRKRSCDRADALFTAEVDRTVGLAEVEERYRQACRLEAIFDY